MILNREERSEDPVVSESEVCMGKKDWNDDT
jgi:hypothetical protein